MQIILGAEYNTYENGLQTPHLETLKTSARRESRCLKFPVKPHVLSDSYDSPNMEHFIVHCRARTESYRMATVPYLQRMLNQYVKDQQYPTNM